MRSKKASHFYPKDEGFAEQNNREKDYAYAEFALPIMQGKESIMLNKHLLIKLLSVLTFILGFFNEHLPGINDKKLCVSLLLSIQAGIVLAY